MSLRKHVRGNGKPVTMKRVQKRNPRRLLEAVPEDWARWDAATAVAGLNWSEFTRRALNAASAIVGALPTETVAPRYTAAGIAAARISLLAQLPEVSEKGPSKKAPKNGAKSRATRAARKG